MTRDKRIVRAAEQLADMNISQAVSCLRENGWIYEAKELLWLYEAVTGTSDGNSKCQNCGAVWPDEFLLPVEDLSERVAPGEPMPSGECPDPDCGAVCHPTKENEKE